jgi:hypothetical protein
MTKEEMVNKLSNKFCTVKFTKVNGDTRLMKCTLMSEYLPETKTNNKKENDSVVTVYDVEVNGWRSFKVDSVVDFKTCCESEKEI